MTYPKTINSEISKLHSKLKEYERELDEKISARPHDSADRILEGSVRFIKLNIGDTQRRIQGLFWSQFQGDEQRDRGTTTSFRIHITTAQSERARTLSSIKDHIKTIPTNPFKPRYNHIE